MGKNMEQLNCNWHTFSDHLKELMQSLMDSKNFSYVTLVCEDKIRLKAHKFVLSACSPILQPLINNLLPGKDSFIDLRGIQSQEMHSLLHFMYLGQVTIYKDRMNEFLNAAKSLQISEISKDFESEEEDPRKDQESNKNMNPQSSLFQSNVPDDDIVTSRNSEVKLYSCSQCEKSFTCRQGLYEHKKKIHEGRKYSCNKC